MSVLDLGLESHDVSVLGKISWDWFVRFKSFNGRKHLKMTNTPAFCLSVASTHRLETAAHAAFLDVESVMPRETALAERNTSKTWLSSSYVIYLQTHTQTVPDILDSWGDIFSQMIYHSELDGSYFTCLCMHIKFINNKTIKCYLRLISAFNSIVISLL